MERGAELGREFLEGRQREKKLAQDLKDALQLLRQASSTLERNAGNNPKLKREALDYQAFCQKMKKEYPRLD